MRGLALITLLQTRVRQQRAPIWSKSPRRQPARNIATPNIATPNPIPFPFPHPHPPRILSGTLHPHPPLFCLSGTHDPKTAPKPSQTKNPPTPTPTPRPHRPHKPPKTRGKKEKKNTWPGIFESRTATPLGNPRPPLGHRLSHKILSILDNPSPSEDRWQLPFPPRQWRSQVRKRAHQLQRRGARHVYVCNAPRAPSRGREGERGSILRRKRGATGCTSDGGGLGLREGGRAVT